MLDFNAAGFEHDCRTLPSFLGATAAFRTDRCAAVFFFVVESLKDFCGWNVIYFADVDVSKEFGHHVVSSEISSLRATLYVVIIVS